MTTVRSLWFGWTKTQAAFRNKLGQPPSTLFKSTLLREDLFLVFNESLFCVDRGGAEEGIAQEACRQVFEGHASADAAWLHVDYYIADIAVEV